MDFVASSMPLHRAGTSSQKPTGTYAQQYRYVWWSTHMTLQCEVREHGQVPLRLRVFSTYLCAGEGQDFTYHEFFQSLTCRVCSRPVSVHCTCLYLQFACDLFIILYSCTILVNATAASASPQTSLAVGVSVCKSMQNKLHHRYWSCCEGFGITALQ